VKRTANPTFIFAVSQNNVPDSELTPRFLPTSLANCHTWSAYSFIQSAPCL